MALAAVIKPSIIKAADAKDLVKGLERMGCGPQDVYVKTFDSAYDSSSLFPSGHIRLRDWEGVNPTIKHSNGQHIADEFRALKRMHDTLPKNVATPLALFGNMHGEVKGYLSEFVKGTCLHDYFVQPDLWAQYGLVARDVLHELVRVVAELNARAIGHYDMADYNIMVTYDGKVVLIDPFPALRSTRRTDTDLVHDILDRATLMGMITPEEYNDLSYTLLTSPQER
jgi:tRNA A-37 threonylcarbamoyl transferase component Bud32